MGWVVCGLWFVVCGLWFVVCGLWFVVCGLWAVVLSLWFMACASHAIVVCTCSFLMGITPSPCKYSGGLKRCSSNDTRVAKRARILMAWLTSARAFLSLRVT